MQVYGIRVEPSPLDRGRQRLCARVDYDDSTDSDELWFDVPRRHAPALSVSGNPWLAALLPLASLLGQKLRIPHPVDPVLLSGAHRLQRIWSTWYGAPSIVELDAELALPSPGSRPGGSVAAFFSGGADSFFTVLRDRGTAPPSEREPVDSLITVHGFDVPVADRAAFLRLLARQRPVADRLSLDRIDVVTNIRETRWGTVPWPQIGHGAALASVALALEGALSRVYLAAGGGYRGLHPWGSHAITDPLFSTTTLAVVHDGAAWLRTEKIEAIASSALAREALRVCYANDDDRNCGSCPKCLRTMITLEICGVLGVCATFPTRPDLLAAVARMDASHFADARELEDICRLARARRRDDVVEALDHCAARSRRRRLLRKGLAWAGRPLRGAGSLVRRMST